MTMNPYTKKTEESSGESVSNAEAENVDVVKKKKQPRKMTLKRKVSYALAKPLIFLFVKFIWLTCRVKVIGQENMDAVIADNKIVIPCYWHQQHLFCAWYMFKQIKHGVKVGFLISPSVDGEMPAQLAASQGATIIRGSSTRTGAQALRDMYQVITKDKVSPVTSPDGPTGPIFKFKPGAAMLSQMTKAPILPMAFTAKNAWYLKSWDKFMIPKPFTQIVISVGELVYIDKSEKDLPLLQEKMEAKINGMMVLAKEELK